MGTGTVTTERNEAECQIHYVITTQNPLSLEQHIGINVIHTMARENKDLDMLTSEYSKGKEARSYGSVTCKSEVNKEEVTFPKLTLECYWKTLL